jgi:acyl-CoA hydrolase
MSNQKKEKLVSDSATTMTELVMPNDTNPLGNLMGGYLMRWMDICAAICAARHCERHVVTVSVDHVSFHSAINLGEVITLKSTVTRAFNTSVEIYIEVFASEMPGGNERKCNHAYMTFVALDKNTRKPIEVPALKPLSGEEQKLFEGASRRRELRLILAGKMKPSEAFEIKNFFAQY